MAQAIIAICYLLAQNVPCDTWLPSTKEGAQGSVDRVTETRGWGCGKDGKAASAFCAHPLNVCSVGGGRGALQCLCFTHPQRRWNLPGKGLKRQSNTAA